MQKPLILVYSPLLFTLFDLIFPLQQLHTLLLLGAPLLSITSTVTPSPHERLCYRKQIVGGYISGSVNFRILCICRMELLGSCPVASDINLRVCRRAVWCFRVVSCRVWHNVDTVHCRSVDGQKMLKVHLRQHCCC